MSLNGRLSSLRPRVAARQLVVPQQQRRCLNEFITTTIDAPNHQSTPPNNTCFRLAIKDNIATLPSDGPTTCASHILATHASPFEATVVTQLKRRGAVVVGKTNLDEFGMGTHSTHSAYGAVAQDDGGNDNSSSSSAGGSSGGSAVAVASGRADVALGTDTGGSVRLPAAYCGVVGYKPSYGMVSRYGVVPYANSLDTVGLLAREVNVIRRLMVGGGEEDGPGLAAVHDPKDPTSLSAAARQRCTAGTKQQWYSSPAAAPMDAASASALLRPLTIGIPVEYSVEELEDCVRQGWEDTATFLRDELGARVIPVSLPSTRHALSAYYVLAPAEASSNLAKYDGVRYGPKQHEIESSSSSSSSSSQDNNVLYAKVRAQGFGPEVQRRVLLGAYTLSSAAMDNYFVQAQRVRQLVRRDFDRVFALPNPLLDADAQHVDLAALDETLLLEDKRGPPQVDFLLCPTAPTRPPLLADVQAGLRQSPVDAYVNDVLTVPASLAGLPAVSVPRAVAGGGGGDVMGLQLIGQYWDDARLLAVAEALSVLYAGSR